MTTTTAIATVHTVHVPGATLHYEVRGSGPVLLLLGAPMPAADFAPLADALADDHTVVTTDPRGISASVVDDPEQDSTPELRADDVVAILDDLGVVDADVFGSSGGAVTGLALVARHPARVRTLVAHEPPLLTLLPDAEEQLAGTDDLVATFRTQGLGAAWAKFMGSAGFDPDEQAPGTVQPSEQDLANGAHFFGHEILGTVHHAPDIPALAGGPARVVVGVGATSGALVTSRTSVALADLLGSAPAEFPGDHGGFVGQPREFADALWTVLGAA
jgi:pimeloyl-ACP methyl ester carboxylesterase